MQCFVSKSLSPILLSIHGAEADHSNKTCTMQMKNKKKHGIEKLVPEKDAKLHGVHTKGFVEKTILVLTLLFQVGTGVGRLFKCHCQTIGRRTIAWVKFQLGLS